MYPWRADSSRRIDRDASGGKIREEPWKITKEGTPIYLFVKQSAASLLVTEPIICRYWDEDGEGKTRRARKARGHA